MPLNSNGTGSYRFSLNGPQWAYLRYQNSDADTAKFFDYVLYLSPGDDLNFKADFKIKDNGIVVTGKGSNNNQPLLSILEGESGRQFYGDTLPNRIIAFANKHQAELRSAFDKYTGTYKPSADFIKKKNRTFFMPL